MHTLRSSKILSCFLKRHFGNNCNDILKYGINNNVATITLTNPRKANPLSIDLMERLYSILNEVENIDKARCLVIRHEGKFFSSGHDLNDLFDKKNNWSAHEKKQLQQTFSTCSKLNIKLNEFLLPTIAVIEGHASAGGLQLAASCDIIIASENALFSVPGSQRGRFCHTPGVALGNRVSQNKSLEWLLLGTVVNANEALNAGLINFLVQHNDSIDDKLTEITNKFISASKNIYNGKLGFLEQQKYRGNLRQQYEIAEKYMIECFETNDASEGTRSMMEKRDPIFDV
eukprot:389117_1